MIQIKFLGKNKAFIIGAITGVTVYLFNFLFGFESNLIGKSLRMVFYPAILVDNYLSPAFFDVKSYWLNSSVSLLCFAIWMGIVFASTNWVYKKIKINIK